jgi:hypothetical protein
LTSGRLVCYKVVWSSPGAWAPHGGRRRRGGGKRGFGTLIHPSGQPGDRYRGKTAPPSGPAWRHSVLLHHHDALEAGRADARRLLRLPPCAAFPLGLLTPLLAVATAAPDTARLLSGSRQARSTRRPSLAYRDAMASRSPSRWWAGAEGAPGVRRHAGGRSYHRPGTPHCGFPHEYSRKRVRPWTVVRRVWVVTGTSCSWNPSLEAIDMTMCDITQEASSKEHTVGLR